MAKAKLDETLSMYYELDDFTDPWTEPETIVLHHGMAESSRAWYAWVPLLARQYRVVRPDMRGLGHSSAPPADFPWSSETFATDLKLLLDHLDVSRVHLVGAKVGGAVGLQFALNWPERVASLTTVTSPVKASRGPVNHAAWGDLVAQEGTEVWARTTMTNRLGSSASPELFEWWVQLMSQTRADVLSAILHRVPGIDLTPRLSELRVPTLMIAAAGSTNTPIHVARAWAATIPGARLEVVEADSNHLAATHPELCAQLTLDFIRSVGADTSGS